MSYEIAGIQSDNTPEYSIVRIKLKIGGNLHEVFFKSSDIRLTENAETILVFSILPCLSVRCNMRLDCEISRQLLNSTSKIMDIYCAWDSSFNRIDIENAIPVEKDNPTENRVGVFFSGGVDSFYTLLRNRDDITDIIFVHGFDLRLDETGLREKTAGMVRDVGANLGKNVIEIETNLREFLDHFVNWLSLGFGPALTSVGHLLAPFFKKLFISAGYTYANMEPCGSHVLLDPLWSSDSLEFVHYGAEASRVDKVAFISSFDVALQSLRVCTVKADGAYNCGECIKCLRTMINLYVVGVLNKCKTFPLELELGKIDKTFIFLRESEQGFIRQSMRVIEERCGDKKLYKVLQKVLNRPRWKCYYIFAWNDPIEFVKKVINHAFIKIHGFKRGHFFL